MRIIRALSFGIALWILIFFEVNILMFGFNIKPPSGVYFTLHFIFLTIFALLCNLSYFWGKEIKTGLLQGIIIGIIFVIVGIILDASITIPLFVKDYNFLLRKDILFGELIILILTSIVGWAKR